MRLGFALALAIVPQAVDAIPAPSRVQLFDRVLTFTLPADMTMANRRDNGTNVLIEYVPKGETLGNWTRLVTIQAYRGLGRSTMSSAEIARQAFYPAACKNGPLYRDDGERNLGDGLKLSVIANGCASLPAGAYPKAMRGAGEQDFILMFRDGDAVYTLNYAFRGKPFVGKAPPIPPQDGKLLLRGVFGEVTLDAARS